MWENIGHELSLRLRNSRDIMNLLSLISKDMAKGNNAQKKEVKKPKKAKK